jgi:PKD repeat protein
VSLLGKNIMAGCILVMVLALLAIAVPVGAWTSSTPTPGWYDCSWNFRQSIVIDRSKVAGSLSNFPVLISLASNTNLSSHARADGNDILFTSSDGTTKIPHEIESYKSSNGALVAWVKVPSITTGSNTVLYMYYGNPSAANQRNAANAWSNGYKDVWHLDEGGTGPRSDSTGSGSSLNTRNYKGNEGTPGQIGGADSLDGTSKYLESAGNVGITGSAARTVTFWAKLANTNRNGMVGWGTNAVTSEFEAAVRNNKYFLWSYGGGHDWENIATPLTGSWNYYAVTYDGTTARWYMNGSQFGCGYAHTYTTADSHAFVGYEFDSGQSSIAYMNGMMDEVHVAGSARSAQWIQTEFNNQNSPSAFSSLQAEQKAGDGSTCRIPTPPVANFIANPSSGNAPLPVTFTDQSTNTPIAWSWEFGDGGTSSLQNPVYIYASAGTYTVKLTVSNADGSNTLAKQNFVTATANTQPVANFIANPSSGKAPLSVTFTDQSTNTPTAWSWEFGDGGTSSLQNPVYTYAAPGIYTVSLTVSNGYGSDKMVKQTSITVAIDCGDSGSLVTSDGKTVGCAGVSNDNSNLYMSYTGSPSNPLTRVDWSWGYSASDIPQNNGVPAPDKFRSTYSFRDGEFSYTFPGVDISPVMSSDIDHLVISAHALTKSGDDAWFLDSNGAKYFTYPLKRVALSLSPHNAVLELPGQQSQSVTVTVKERSSPVSRAPILFTTDFGSFTGGSTVATATSNSNGVATISISSSTPGTADLAAGIDSNGNGIIDAWEWTSLTTVEWVAATTISIEPLTATVQLPQTDQVLTATVFDQDENPMYTVPVTFTTTGGSIAGMNPVSPDGDGQAMVTVSSSTDGMATVTAFVDANGNGIPDSGELSTTSTVTWIAAPTTPTPST